jgi:hypothetical protein
MKRLFVIVMLTILCGGNAMAGSSNCTDTSSLTWYQANPYTNLDVSQCVVNATQGDAGNETVNYSLLAYLPENPSDGGILLLLWIKRHLNMTYVLRGIPILNGAAMVTPIQGVNRAALVMNQPIRQLTEVSQTR